MNRIQKVSTSIALAALIFSSIGGSFAFAKEDRASDKSKGKAEIARETVKKQIESAKEKLDRAKKQIESIKKELEDKAKIEYEKSKKSNDKSSKKDDDDFDDDDNGKHKGKDEGNKYGQASEKYYLLKLVSATAPETLVDWTNLLAKLDDLKKQTETLINSISKKQRALLPKPDQALKDAHEAIEEAVEKASKALRNAVKTTDSKAIVAAISALYKAKTDELAQGNLEYQALKDAIAKLPAITPVPTITPSPTTVPSITPAPTATTAPSATPTPSVTPDPSATPAPAATPDPSATPTPSITPVPSASPEPIVTSTPTVSPMIITLGASSSTKTQFKRPAPTAKPFVKKPQIKR